MTVIDAQEATATKLCREPSCGNDSNWESGIYAGLCRTHAFDKRRRNGGIGPVGVKHENPLGKVVRDSRAPGVHSDQARRILRAARTLDQADSKAEALEAKRIAAIEKVNKRFAALGRALKQHLREAADEYAQLVREITQT